MSEIVEILGEKKFFGSRNAELKTRVVFNEEQKIQYENNLFFDISQQTQFIEEKRLSNIFRIYGKISPIMNFNLYQKTIDGDISINLDQNLVDFNLKNWSIVVLRSKNIELGYDQNGNLITSKGVKILQKFVDNNPNGEMTLDLNLKNGLPAKYFESSVYTENFGFLLPLGHNFNVGDQVKVKTNNQFLLEDGVYEIVIVDGNRVFIDLKPNLNYNQKISVDPGKQAQNIKDYKDAQDNNQLIDQLVDQKKINGLLFTTLTAAELSNNVRPNVLPIINPDFYLEKIVEKERLEYYIKTLEVISVLNELDECGFSINNFGKNYFNFIFDNDINISSYLNNLNEPLTDLYIGIIKNGPEDIINFGKVESHLSNFVEFLGEDYGIEQITDNVFLGKKPKVGDLYFHSICEHTTENLTEIELNHFHHRFIYNDVLFKYNPFQKIQLKLKSVYIEDTDNVNTKPSYSVYSKQLEKYIWRDIIDIGITDEDGNVIDFPFANGSFYVYTDLNFFLISERNYTRKYELNKNDISSVGNIFENIFDDLIDDFNEEEEIKPYNKYKDKKC